MLVLAVSVLLIGFVSVGEARATHGVNSVSPNSLPQGVSSAAITISGTGFSSALGPANVTVSGAGVTVTDVVVVSATSITAEVTVAQGAALGARNVTVTQGLGGVDTFTCVGCLTITAGPVITSIAPPGGSNTGITNLTANGTGFVDGAQLRLRREGFEDIVASSTTVVGGTSISGPLDLTGQAPGHWIVVVVNPDGGVGTFGDGTSTGFQISGSTPTVISVTPSTRAAGSTGSVLTVTGTNFARGAEFSFGDGVTDTDATWENLTTYTVTVDIAPAAVPGPRSVTITNTDSQSSAPCVDCFTVSAAPTISSVVPSSRGQGATSEALVITGTGFLPAAEVTVSGEGVTVDSVVRDSSTQLTVTVTVASDAAATERTLTVLNTDGGTDTAPFTVNPRPTITDMTPGSRGQNASTQEIVVTGADFVDTPTVTVSGTGVTVDSVVFDSATQLTLVVTISPTAPVGARDVTVTNPDGGTSTAVGAFTVNEGPSIVSLAPDTLATGVSDHDVIVTGGGFAGTPTVAFSGEGITVNSVVRDSSNQLTVNITTASEAPLGDRDVTVTNPDGGTVTAEDAFTVTAPPTVTDVVPDTLGQGATADLTITGTGFLTGAEVSVPGGGITVNSVTFVSATELTANVTVANGAPTGARDVTVTNPDAGTATCTDCLTVSTGPTITSITPSAGANSGTVTITNLAGSGFDADAEVQLEREGFDPVPMTGETVNGPGTSITGTFDLAPAGDAPVAPGAWTVRVTNPGDGGTATLEDAFTVTGSAPSVTSASPDEVAQGTAPTVEVLGTGFADGAAVSFSGEGITVTDTTVVSSTQIDVDLAVAADAPVGLRTITVTNTDTQSDTCVDCLTVNAAPTTTSISPDSFDQGDSGSVTITGTGYAATPTVTAAGTGVTFSDIVRVSDTELTATITVAADATVGDRTLTVTNPDGGSSTCTDCLTITAPPVPPTLTSLDPSSLGQGAANQTVVVTGTGFDAAPTVMFEGTGITVENTVRDSDTQITLTISVAADATVGPRDVTVTNSDSGSDTLEDGFTVNAAPTTTSISPDSFEQGDSGSVTITGTGYVATPTVTASGTGVTFTDIVRVSATELTATVTVAADAPVGDRTLTVTNPDGGSSTCTDCLTITASPVTDPTVTSLAPSSRGQGAVGQTVVVTGTGFDAAPTVTFEGTGITVTNTVRDSATQLTLTISVAAGATVGPRDVTVTNSDSGTDTLVDGFTVNAAPTTTALSPSTFDRGATGPVTITGTGYAATPTVTASGTGVTFSNVVRVSATQLTATITVAPTAPVGARTVTVTNPDAGVSTCACLTITAPGNIGLAGWQGLGNAILNGPAVASAAPNTSAVLFRAPDNSLQVRPFSNNTFGGASSLGGIVLSGPGAAARGNAIDFVARGSDNAVWINSCTVSSCTGWFSLGGQTLHAPSLVSSTPGRIDVFATGIDAQLYQRTGINGQWGAWTPLGGILRGGPAVTSGGPNLLDLVMRGNDGGIYTRSFNVTWGPFIRLPGLMLDEAALVARPGGIVDLFVRGADNALWYARRVGGVWGGFQSLGGVLTSGPGAALISTSPNHVIQIAARGSDGRLYVNRAAF